MYPYPQSSELFEMSYVLNYNFMESVFGEMLPVFCLNYRIIIIDVITNYFWNICFFGHMVGYCRFTKLGLYNFITYQKWFAIMFYYLCMSHKY